MFERSVIQCEYSRVYYACSVLCVYIFVVRVLCFKMTDMPNIAIGMPYKMPMGLNGHLIMDFAMYIHVHDDYSANEIIFDIPGLFDSINFLNSKK